MSWQDRLPRGGIVVSDEVWVTLDVEAILEQDGAGPRGVGGDRPGAGAGT